MDFSLTSRQSDLIAKATSDAQLFVRSDGGSDLAGSSAWDRWAANGWTGLCVPTAWGGQGYSALDSVLAFEALGQNGADRSALFATGAHLFGCAMAIVRFATQNGMSDWVSRLAKGHSVGALAFTEPSGGSEVGYGKTYLEAKGDDFVLKGIKTLVTNAVTADVFIVLAHDPSATAPLNTTMVLVPANSAGVICTRIEGGVGLSGTGMGTVSFDECFVPASHILGRKGGGMGVMLETMRWERTCILAGALGRLDRDFREVGSYLSKRRDSKGPLLQHQAVGHQLADVRQRIESARWLMYKAAWELDQNGCPLFYPALSKLTIAETLVDCSVSLQSLMGGAGWANSLDLGHAVQDALAMANASGTSNVQRNTIAMRMTTR